MNIEGYFIIAILGVLAFLVARMGLILYVQGAGKAGKDHELFMEGYKAGLQENQKETPKKPTEDVLGYKCPVCGKSVWGLVSKMQYCGECGNKMDWSDEE